MAVNGEFEKMTSSDLDLTSQTETEDTDTGDIEESGTTFSSSDGNESSVSSISSSTASSVTSKGSKNVEMKSISSADGSTSTGNTEQSDIDCSDHVFKYPSVPKVSYDFTEVSELSNFENLSNYGQKTPSRSRGDDKKGGVKDKKMFKFPDFMSMKGGWYTHPCFKNYWEHYHTVMNWCKKHYEVYNSVTSPVKPLSHCQAMPYQDFQQSSSTLSWQQYYQLNSYYYNTPYRNTVGRSRNGARSNRKNGKKKKKKRSSRRSRSLKGEGHDTFMEDTDETFEMEITDEMMEFFKQSEEHRRARDEERKAAKEGPQEEEHVNIEEVKVTAQKGPTTEAPKVRPGAKRTSEMKLLYGKGAPMIHGMETALQMTFDRNLDIKQPKMWPNMPLKLVFG